MINKYFLKNARGYIFKNRTKILTVLGIFGIYGTAVSASYSTLKASKILEKYNKKILSKKDIIKLTWKEYIPPALISLISVFCIIKSNRIQASQHMALMTLYSLTERSFREYQDKVYQTFGKNKAIKIQDDIQKEKLNHKPIISNDVIITGYGNILCYDIVSDRYFKSDREKIKRIENEFNYSLRSEMKLSLNELYYRLGLQPIKLGDNVGWNIEKDLLTFNFSSLLASDGNPCLVIDYQVYPL